LTLPATAPPLPDLGRPAVLLLRRLWGLMLRHVYLHLGSWPRLIEMLYWPIVNMSMWGFVSLYLVRQFSNATIVFDTMLGGVLLSEVFLRTSTTVLMLYLEEVWSRNLGHLFASPLRLIEYVVGLLGLSLLRAAISIVPAVVVAKILFGYSLLSIGWPLVSFVILLAVNGCWYGLLIVSMLIRFGMAAEWLAWMFTWLLLPLIAPYYPVAILPEWLQAISWALPATYVFECMKALAAGHPFESGYLLKALVLNIFYMIGAGVIFYRAYQDARRRGGLLQMGE